MTTTMTVKNVSKPFTLRELYAKINKPRLEVLKWFQELGLVADNYTCPGNDCYQMILAPSICIDGYQWVCGNENKKHTFKRSVRKGTWFEGSRLAMEEIIIIVYFWVHEYMQSQVRQELNITNSESVVAYFNYCREVAVDVIIKNSGKIGGDNHVVEIIVSKLARRKPTARGKKPEEQWVYCGVELGKSLGKCFMVPVEIHYTTTLINVIKEFILPGTIIYCECLNVYQEFDGQGLNDVCSEHNVILTDNLKSIRVDGHSVEGLWNLLKPSLPPYNRQRDKARFTGYLGEYLYRKCIRNSPDKFLQFLQDIAHLYTPSV